MTGTTLNQWILAFQCGQRNKVLSWHYFICYIFWQVYIRSQTEECIQATFLDKKKVPSSTVEGFMCKNVQQRGSLYNFQC